MFYCLSKLYWKYIDEVNEGVCVSCPYSAYLYVTFLWKTKIFVKSSLTIGLVELFNKSVCCQLSFRFIFLKIFANDCPNSYDEKQLTLRWKKYECWENMKVMIVDTFRAGVRVPCPPPPIYDTMIYYYISIRIR